MPSERRQQGGEVYYGAKNVTLLYPKTEKLSSTKKLHFSWEDGVTVRVEFIDL